MEFTAVIDGCEYRFVETLPSLDGSSLFVLCANLDGKKYICPKDFWHSHAAAAAPEQPAPISANSTAQEKIALFLSLFRGRESLYARRYYNLKTGKSGYVPACQNEWKPGICDKRAQKCPDCPNRAFMPLTANVIRAHLWGKDEFCRDVVGIYPMLEDDRTWLLAVDFDEESWQEDAAAFRETCLAFDITPAVERSRSGNGAHIWFFFSEPVSAADARRLGSGLLTQAMARRHELQFKSYDRLFPSQDTVPKGGFGNLIALPFQGQARQKGNTLFVNEQFVPYQDQWAFLSLLPKITPEKLAESIDKLCTSGETGALLESAEPEPKPWPVRRKAPELHREDFPVQARLMISNLLYVDKQGFSQKALNAVKRLAAFRNPEFYKKQAMRLPVYHMPRVFDCSYEDQDFMGIPRGCMGSLMDLLDAYDAPYVMEDHCQSGHQISIAFRGELRPEQAPAAEALLSYDIGVLSATTAFGKTVVGAYLIGQRKVNTLILVHSSALLEQWKTSLEKFLDVQEALPEPPKRRGRKKRIERIGQIGTGKNTRGGIIDIAIMQSLFEGKEKDVKPFVAEYGMVLCDECHHVAAFTFEKILREVKARYVYGLSATPVRPDGHQPVIFMQCGPVRYLVDAKSQAEKRNFSHYVIPRFTRTRLPAAQHIQDVYSGIVENEARNKFLISDAIRLVAEGRTPLLLTERKEHAIRLEEALRDKADHVFLLLGSGKQKEKREKLAALRSVPTNESLVMIATGKYIGEGFDEPRLDTILLAMPISWKGTLAQYVGRLHRNYEGKQEVRVYDYVDIHIPSLERMYYKRLRGYSELGYCVKASEQDLVSSRIYSAQDYMIPFASDLNDAAKDILIVSPFLKEFQIKAILPTLEKAATAGVIITIRTRPPENCPPAQCAAVTRSIALLTDRGITVETKEGLQHRYTVIDRSIVWYGDINYLSYSARDANALRFESPDIAGELLESWTDGGDFEQLRIEP